MKLAVSVLTVTSSGREAEPSRAAADRPLPSAAASCLLARLDVVYAVAVARSAGVAVGGQWGDAAARSRSHSSRRTRRDQRPADATHHGAHTDRGRPRRRCWWRPVGCLRRRCVCRGWSGRRAPHSVDLRIVDQQQRSRDNNEADEDTRTVGVIRRGSCTACRSAVPSLPGGVGVVPVVHVRAEGDSAYLALRSRAKLTLPVPLPVL